MKRFVTYLYAYRNGQKMKNTGHIRVDVRGQMLDMRISIKDAELDNKKGSFYLVIKKKTVSTISVTEIGMKNGEYNGRVICDSNEYDKQLFQLKDIIGVCVSYGNECYLASCWVDGEEAVIADGGFFESSETEDMIKEIPKEAAESTAEDTTEVIHETTRDDLTEAVTIVENKLPEDVEVSVIAASISDIENESSFETQTLCRKINLSEIYTLPSNYWHFSNNSFLLHGFWNYGYLVVKEDVAENEKRIVLGVPGIFERPEMVMATYFGFPKFEEMPSQMVEMKIGESCSCINGEKKESQKEGVFGCWFVTAQP